MLPMISAPHCAGHVDNGMLLWEAARTDDGSTPAAFERAALHAAVTRVLSRVPLRDCPPERRGRDSSALLSGKDRSATPDQPSTPNKGDGRLPLVCVRNLCVMLK